MTKEQFERLAGDLRELDARIGMFEVDGVSVSVERTLLTPEPDRATFIRWAQRFIRLADLPKAPAVSDPHKSKLGERWTTVTVLRYDERATGRFSLVVLDLSTT